MLGGGSRHLPHRTLGSVKRAYVRILLGCAALVAIGFAGVRAAAAIETSAEENAVRSFHTCAWGMAHPDRPPDEIANDDRARAQMTVLIRRQEACARSAGLRDSPFLGYGGTVHSYRACRTSAAHVRGEFAYMMTLAECDRSVRGLTPGQLQLASGYNVVLPPGTRVRRKHIERFDVRARNGAWWNSPCG